LMIGRAGVFSGLFCKNQPSGTKSQESRARKLVIETWKIHH